MADGFSGLSPGVINGVQFYLGDDTGLEHEWVDSTVVNGQRYFYAVTSYDFGDPADNVSPTECTFPVRLDPKTGDVATKGKNVVVVTPNAASAGYKKAPSGLPVDLVDGYSTASLRYEVYDSPAIRDNHVYRVTFEDSVKMIENYLLKQLVPEPITLENVTTGTVILDRQKKYSRFVTAQ